MKKAVSIAVCLIMLFSFAACNKQPENTVTELSTIDYENYTYTKPDSSVEIEGTLTDSVTWELYDDGSLYIEGNGDMPDWTKIGDLAWRDKSHKINSVYISKGITSVGDFAFAYCQNLSLVYMPDTITSIGNSAFIRCERLEHIQLPDSVTEIGDSAFAYCLTLSSVNIPESVTSLGGSAFGFCTAIKELTIHSDISYVGEGCFAGWTEEQKITVKNSDSYISQNWNLEWSADCSAPININQE